MARIEITPSMWRTRLAPPRVSVLVLRLVPWHWLQKIAMLLFGTAAVAPIAQGADACFADPRVKALIQRSRAIDTCFESDQNRCFNLIEKMDLEDQRKLNAKRLIPFDRTKDVLFDQGVGAVTAHIAVATGPWASSGTHAGTGQLISRCHVLTSAHLFYSETSEAVSDLESPLPGDSAHFRIYFHSGQTCDSNLARHNVQAHIMFRMARYKDDFVCGHRNNDDKCTSRSFFGKSDAVILKLKNYDRRNRSFFKVRPSTVKIPQAGSRVTCWGFPEYNNWIDLPKDLSDQVLWHQLNAKIYPGNYDRGILTNAIAYPGMSGGGCVAASSPQELIGIFTEKNSLTGHAAILASAQTADERSLNFLTPLDHLAERYRAATGKRIEDLDNECD